MIVVLDTNTLISALISPRSVPDRILQAVWQRHIRLALSPHLRDELVRVLQYPHLRRLLDRVWTEAELKQIVSNLVSLAVPVPDLPPSDHWVTDDPDDDWVIQCALTSGAARLVTGDKGLLDVKSVGTVLILTPAAFLDELGRLQ